MLRSGSITRGSETERSPVLTLAKLGGQSTGGACRSGKSPERKKPVTVKRKTRSRRTSGRARRASQRLLKREFSPRHDRAAASALCYDSLVLMRLVTF